MLYISRRTAVAGAALHAVFVVLVTLAEGGPDTAASAEAARNSARFSGLVLALAIAWPTFVESSWRFTEETLLYAFVAAHAVHYAAIVNLAVRDPSHHLHQLQPAALGVASFGTLLLVAIALTIGAQRGWKLGLHRVTVWTAWLLFVIAFGSRARAQTIDLVLLVMMLLALALRARTGLVNR